MELIGRVILDRVGLPLELLKVLPTDKFDLSAIEQGKYPFYLLQDEGWGLLFSNGQQYWGYNLSPNLQIAGTQELLKGSPIRKEDLGCLVWRTLLQVAGVLPKNSELKE